MSLFFYHIYRKLAREEYRRLRTRRGAEPRRPRPPGCTLLQEPLADAPLPVHRAGDAIMPNSPEPSGASSRVSPQRGARRQYSFWSTIGMEVMEAALGMGPGAGPIQQRLDQLQRGGARRGRVHRPPTPPPPWRCCSLLAKAGERMATTEMKINFIKPVAEPATSSPRQRILHRGSHTAVGDVTVRDAAGNLVAKALATYAITRRRRRRPRCGPKAGAPRLKTLRRTRSADPRRPAEEANQCRNRFHRKKPIAPPARSRTPSGFCMNARRQNTPRTARPWPIRAM
ncbi:MAG: PaaI family thioesterase [Desulfomicrobium escambiense]|nr:PaaI family thioesterase [Desulfomicrobium escambiense]